MLSANPSLSPLHSLGQTLSLQIRPLSGQRLFPSALSGSFPSSAQNLGSVQLQVRIGLLGQMCSKLDSTG
jgi:hypothetical protein